MAVNTECSEAVLLLLERGADIDAVVSMRSRLGAWSSRWVCPLMGVVWVGLRVLDSVVWAWSGGKYSISLVGVVYDEWSVGMFPRGRGSVVIGFVGVARNGRVCRGGASSGD